MNFYRLFPRTFAGRQGVWRVDQRLLRKEYRELQGKWHPDVAGASASASASVSGTGTGTGVITTNTTPPNTMNAADAGIHGVGGDAGIHGVGDSALINLAYNTLKSPLARSNYLLKTHHNIDLSSQSTAALYKPSTALLLQILQLNESIESATENQLQHLALQNKNRISHIVSQLDSLYDQKDYKKIAALTVELKYWVNLDNSIKERQFHD